MSEEKYEIGVEFPEGLGLGDEETKALKEKFKADIVETVRKKSGREGPEPMINIINGDIINGKD